MRITFVALAMLASLDSAASAQSPGAALAPYEVLTIVRSLGFDPIGQPVRRGRIYVLRAFDVGDYRVRLVIDAPTGRVLSVSDLGAFDARPSPYDLRFGRDGPPRPPAAIARPIAPDAMRVPPLAQRSANIAPRPPLPRSRPPVPQEETSSAAAAPAAGKSIPAPVAASAAKQPPVPVAPLE